MSSKRTRKTYNKAFVTYLDRLAEMHDMQRIDDGAGSMTYEQSDGIREYIITYTGKQREIEKILILKCSFFTTSVPCAIVLRSDAYNWAWSCKVNICSICFCACPYRPMCELCTQDRLEIEASDEVATYKVWLWRHVSMLNQDTIRCISWQLCGLVLLPA